MNGQSTSWADTLIREIDERGDGLSQWEAKFIDSLMRQRQRGAELSERQVETLNRIHEERVR